MSKTGRFCGPYKKTSKEFKNRGKNYDPMKPGWSQAEVDYLTRNAGMGRVSYPHGTKPYTKADANRFSEGTEHISKKGKTVKK